MRQLTLESATKLQKILSKRIGRELSDKELEEAYDALMGFAIALVELDSDGQKKSPPTKNARLFVAKPKYPIANTNHNVIHCY